MTTEISLIIKVEVPVDPDTAFRMFTAEMDAWYRGGPYGWNDAAKATGVSLEPGVGGRWLEVWDSRTGEGFEIGRVLVWEPGSRLVMSYRPDERSGAGAKVEVGFRAIGNGKTRVILQHSGWSRTAHASNGSNVRTALSGWQTSVKNFQVKSQLRNSEETLMTSSASNQPTIFPALRYPSGQAALDWFKALGFDEWMVVHDSKGRLVHGEVKFGPSAVNIGEMHVAEDHETVDAAGFGISVYVDDVDAHYAKAVAAGLSIEKPPYDTDFGARMYEVHDPAGNVWAFGNYRPGS